MTHQKHDHSVELVVACGEKIFTGRPIEFRRWSPLNVFLGPNGSGKTTFFSKVMDSARMKWPKRVKILGTGRLGPLEKSVASLVGDPSARLFADDDLSSVYNSLYAGVDTAHQAFQLLDKRLDLRVRVQTFLSHVFGRSIRFKSSRRGLQVFGVAGESDYQIVDECHGIKELVTILTFLYDDTFSVLGIDEPELHLHPQFQRYLLDELRACAGHPDQVGKKLVFIVTHSPVMADLRSVDDLHSVLVFHSGRNPERFDSSSLDEEELRKVQQAIPSFHAAQRELLFSSTPLIVEGPSDLAVINAVASRLRLRAGAAGVGLAAMGGKGQLQAFRAMLRGFGKTNAHFILDLDAVLDTKTIHCLDADPMMVRSIADRGGRSLTKEVGEMIGLLNAEYAANEGVDRVAVLAQILSKDAGDELSDSERRVRGKFELIHGALSSVGVHVLRKGAIEAYFATPRTRMADGFAKQQALQSELAAIWDESEPAVLERRYLEIVEIMRGVASLDVPFEDAVREEVSSLVHMIQAEIASSRVDTVDALRSSAKVVAGGFLDLIDTMEVVIDSPAKFSGVITTKSAVGGQRFEFDQETKAYQIVSSDLSE